MTETPPDKGCERPLECSECKKPIAVRYTEVADGIISHTCMCADCPQLEQRLHGLTAAQVMGSAGSETGLICGDCGTALANIRMGSPLGCSHCYEVFADVILAELRTGGRLPATVGNQKKQPTVHVGRTPGELVEISPTSRLAALNEALTETLTREDYEQAAWLRDQIKQLTERPDAEKSDEGKQ